MKKRDILMRHVMKKFLPLFLFISLSSASSLHSMEHVFKVLNQTFSGEYITHIWSACMKKFDEAPWSIKLPAIFVGSYAVTKSFDGLYSWLFGKKTPTQDDINEIKRCCSATVNWSDEVNKRLKLLDDRQVASNLSIGDLEKLNLNKRNIETLHAALIVLDSKSISQDEKCKHLQQVVDSYNFIILGQRHRSVKKHERLETIGNDIESILNCVSPRSQNILGKEEKGKEKTKDKKEKKKEKKGSSRNSFPVRLPGTPHESFFSDDELNAQTTATIPSEMNVLQGDSSFDLNTAKNLKKILPTTNNDNIH